VTQIAINNRPKLEKIQNMLKIIVIRKIANAAMEKILDENYLNVTELNHPIYAAATVITEEINGTGEYKLQTQRSKTSPWLKLHTGEHK